MEKNDRRLIHLNDPLTALSLLSRLPLPATDGTRQSQAAWAYPLVGVLIGGLAALVGLLAHGLGLPSGLCALLALSALILATGAMHEDGLADMADGIWGGWDRGTRLEIMRDSRIGTYGVIALCLSLAARWSALWMLYDISIGAATAALISAAALSRAAMPVVMAALPHARDDGLSRRVGHVSGTTAAIGMGIAGSVAVLLLGSALFWPVVWASLAVLSLGLIAKHKIGGQSGDILGSAQQVGEIAVLFALLV